MILQCLFFCCSFAPRTTDEIYRQRPPPQLLSWSPRIFLHEDLLTGPEADSLVEYSKHVFAERPSTNMGEQRGSRTSSTFWMNSTVEQTDSMLRTLLQRMHEAVMVPLHHGEELQISRYRKGEKYEFHHDTDQRLARILTILIYLSDVREGGETIFPFAIAAQADGKHELLSSEPPLPPPVDLNNLRKSGIKPMAPYCARARNGTADFVTVRPRKGAAVVFYSMSPGLQIDERAWHGACPVISRDDEKWVAQRWIKWQSRKGRFYVGP